MSDSSGGTSRSQAPRTATTSNAILGLLALRPVWSTWELKTQLRRNLRFFWPRAESRIYEEAKRLVDRGFAEAERSYVGRRPRTTYTITGDGARALQRWLETPPRPTHLECEPLLRILFADLATAEQLQAAIDQIRADAEAIQAMGRTVGDEYLAGTAPFQDQVHARAFVFDFLSHHARMLLEWAGRTEAELARWPDLSAAERASRAVQSIRDELTTYREVGTLRP